MVLFTSSLLDLISSNKKKVLNCPFFKYHLGLSIYPWAHSRYTEGTIFRKSPVCAHTNVTHKQSMLGCYTGATASKNAYFQHVFAETINTSIRMQMPNPSPKPKNNASLCVCRGAGVAPLPPRGGKPTPSSYVPKIFISSIIYICVVGRLGIEKKCVFSSSLSWVIKFILNKKKLVK